MKGRSVDNSGKISNEELYLASHFTKLMQQETHKKHILLMKTTYQWIYTMEYPIPFCVVCGKQRFKCSNGSSNIQKT